MATSTSQSSLAYLSDMVMVQLVSRLLPATQTCLYLSLGMGSGIDQKSTPTILIPGHRQPSSSLTSLTSQLQGMETNERPSPFRSAESRGRHLVEQSTKLSLFIYIQWVIGMNWLQFWNSLIQTMAQMQKGFEYEDKKEVKLHPIVVSLMGLCQATEPLMPGDATRRIGEQLGLQFDERLAMRLIGHICDEKVFGLLGSIKAIRMKKSGELMISKAETLKALAAREVEGMRPSVCPYFETAGEEQLWIGKE